MSILFCTFSDGTRVSEDILDIFIQEHQDQPLKSEKAPFPHPKEKPNFKSDDKIHIIHIFGMYRNI